MDLAPLNLPQRLHLYSLARTYHRLTREGNLERFWLVTFEDWFIRWPLVEELVERGLLPPEAVAGYRLNDAMLAIVEEATKIKTGVSSLLSHSAILSTHLPVAFRSSWMRWKKSGRLGWMNVRCSRAS